MVKVLLIAKVLASSCVKFGARLLLIVFPDRNLRCSWFCTSTINVCLCNFSYTWRDRSKQDPIAAGNAKHAQSANVSSSLSLCFLKMIVLFPRPLVCHDRGTDYIESRSFFDTTPLGRIVNRFSKDVDVLDNFLTDSIRMYTLTLATVISIVVLIIVYYPIFAAVMVPMVGVFYFAAAFYRASAREIKRHEAVRRSKVFSAFGEALSGTSTIRAYGVQEIARLKLENAIDEMNSAYFLTFAAQCWLSIRLDIVGNVLALTTCLLVVTDKFKINPSTSAVILSYVLQLIGMIQFMVKQLAEMENSMNSTERIYHYGNELPAEEPPEASQFPSPPSNWPEHGEIKFESAEMRYRPGLPLVLKGLDLQVRGGERIGVIGRTGAGKSSIMSCLFRLVELSGGRIEIDGLDISKLRLKDLRSRLSIIPQGRVFSYLLHRVPRAVKLSN